MALSNAQLLMLDNLIYTNYVSYCDEANKNKLILSKKVIIICSIIVCLILVFIIIMVTNPSKILEEKIIINDFLVWNNDDKNESIYN